MGFTSAHSGFAPLCGLTCSSLSGLCYGIEYMFYAVPYGTDFRNGWKFVSSLKRGFVIGCYRFGGMGLGGVWCMVWLWRKR